MFFAFLSFWNNSDMNDFMQNILDVFYLHEKHTNGTTWLNVFLSQGVKHG